MFLVGLIRGIGGFFTLTKGIETVVSKNIESWKITAASISLLTVAILLISSACLLIIKRNKTAWMFSWISVCLFIIGGLINGFLLFGKPQIDGQIVNWGISILIGLFLISGKKSLKN